MDYNKVAVDVFNRLSQEYMDKFMDVGLYGEALEVFCRNIIPHNAEILELACGPGNITKYLLEKRPDFKVLATDLAPKMLELAQINNPQAEILLMDARDIAKLDRKFDGIVCGFCMPYLNKQEAIQLIKDSAKKLNTDGLLYLSTMEDDNKKSGIECGSHGDELFMHYHQADYLGEALFESHLKLLEIQRKDFTYPDGRKGVDLVLIARYLGGKQDGKS